MFATEIDGECTNRYLDQEVRPMLGVPSGALALKPIQRNKIPTETRKNLRQPLLPDR